jgi:rod shape-determining protein MreD
LTLSADVIIRLTGLAIALVVVQLAAVSQLALLGATADLSPLLIMAVGLLAGSVAGAAMGFGVGLFIDAALLQTLGVTSLVFVLIGYASGRYRELSDPSNALVPVGVGALATAGATFGFSIIQFLLGVDAPVSLLLLREMLATILINATIALPVYLLVRRVLRDHLPEEPRRRRRRAVTPTGGLSPLHEA